MAPTAVLLPMLLGMDWMDPVYLLDRFGAELLWISLFIIFIECGLFFPFLPGDTLLLSLGVFIATEDLDIFPGSPGVELLIALVLLTTAAFLGNVVGYEIGRAIGPPLYRRNGRVLKKKYFDQTEVFFDKHGNKALVIGRFVPFVRTYITVVAGVTRMQRHRSLVWRLVGAVAWVLSITLTGYFLGTRVPWLRDNIDYAILTILAISVVPVAFEWWRHRRTSSPEADDSATTAAPTATSWARTSARSEGPVTHPSFPAVQGCIFCAIVARQAEASVVYEDETVVVFMDLNPVTPGHLLVVPRGARWASRTSMEPRALTSGRSVVDMARALRRSSLRCEGINVLLCDGEVAFQTVFHFHLHVIPRYPGDGWTLKADPPERERSLLDSDAQAIKDAIASTA